MTEVIELYCQSLGFKPGWTWGEPPFQGNICRNEISISLTLSTQITADTGSGSVCIQMVNIDHYHPELPGRNVDVGSLSDRDYGMRDFAVTDPGAIAWCLGNRFSSKTKIWGQDSGSAGFGVRAL